MQTGSSGPSPTPGPDPVGRSTGTNVGLYLILVVVWGLNYLFVRSGLTHSPALWLATGRALLGALVVGLYLVARPSARGRLDGPGIRDAVLLGLPTTAIFFGLWFAAAGAAYPGEAAVLVYTFPLWVALLSVPVLRIRLRPIGVAGIATGFAGVVLVSEPWTAARSIPAWAVAALLLGAISWAVGTVLYRRRFEDRELEEANFYQLVGGSAGLLIASIAIESTPPTISLPLLLDLLWLGVIGTAVGYGIWFHLLARIPATELSAYVFLVPVVALAASVLLVAERLDPVQVVGVVAVLVSLYVTARSQSGPSATPAPRPGGADD